MKIEKATQVNLKELMAIFARARSFMASTGNPNQWINGYPSEELIYQDIVHGHCFICRTDDNHIAAAFVFIIGDDPTYAIIENGKWLNDKIYGVIHRLASDGTKKGIAKFCIEWCFSQINNLRVDTHANNKVMQSILKREGFKYCGIIYTHNGTERLAFQKTQ
ncbi:MAG: GNAT family N-acetyltransferase [Bacteroidales bacterium]|nr:GNAT family N-acetyltransferase [Bacteroidales bacterium]MDD4420463.1 GNAT family N-acetyltransferase [Bacteroidales bacterium]